MAATVSPWSKPGAWALEAEEHDAELLKQQNKPESAADFPTLTTAAATKTSKKKKGQTLSLAEFSTYSAPKPAAEPVGLTHEDLMSLPTGPRERTEEEIRSSRWGTGGFRSFDRGGRGGGGGDESRWGGGQGRSGDRDRERNGGGGPRDSGPSRADEADNWATMKKSPSNGYDRRESGGGRDRGGFFDSKADESDNWASNKSYAPPPPRERRGGGGGFGSTNGGADSSDFWGKRREETTNGGGNESGSGGGARPRLNLQPRTLPVVSDGGSAPALVAPAPTPASPVAPVPTPAPVKPKGSNPFGAARPREEVLAEKGQDWKKIDEQLDSMKIKEASERAEAGAGAGFGRRSFGSGNGRSGGRAEVNWRKPEANGDTDNDSASQSAEKNEEEEELVQEEN